MPPKRQLWIACLTCIVAAVLLDFSTIHREQTSDALIPVLSSLTHWTPFFWGQRYYGMLWPLLLQPVQHPLHNFLWQNGIAFAMGLGAHFAVAAYLLRSRAALAVGALSAASVVGLTSPHWAFTNLGPVLFFATPLVLGLGALYLLERTPLRPLTALGAALLMGLASWFNVSTTLPLGVLALARPQTSRALRLRQLALLAAGSLWGMFLMAQVNLPGPSFGIISPALWPTAVATTARDAVSTLRDHFAHRDVAGMPPLFALLLVAALGGGVWAALSKPAQRSLRPHLPTLLRALGLNAGFALFVCTQHWAQINGFSGRYWYPVILIVQVLALAVPLVPLAAQLGKFRPYLDGAAAATVALACVLMYGWPSAQVMRQELDRWAGTYTAEIVESRASVVAGDFWQVWPAVFHTNLVLHEQGSTRRVWAMTNKANQQLEAAPPGMLARARIFVPHSDIDFLAQMQRSGAPPLQLVQRGKRFDVVSFARP